MNKVKDWLFTQILRLAAVIGKKDIAILAPGTAQKYVDYLQYQDVPIEKEFCDFEICPECGSPPVDEFLLAACDTYSEAFSHLEDVKGIEPMQTPSGEWGLRVFILNGMLLSYLPRQFMTFPVQYVINGVPE